MKIVYLASSTLPSRTANSVHVMHICEAFADLGHEVTLVTPSNAKRELSGVSDLHSYYGVKRNFKIEKFVFIQKLGGTLRKLTMKRGYAKALNRLQPDLVYGRSYEGCLTSVAKGFPTCMELHAPFGRRKLAKPEHSAFVAAAALKRVVVISDALKALVEKQLPEAMRDKIVVAHDAASRVDDYSSVPAEWPGRPECLQVGYVGGLYPGRGVELIVGMATALPDMDFHMVGGAAEDIAALREKGVPGNMHFHGHVPASEVSQYHNACDVLLAPYQKKVAVAGGGDTSAFMSPLKIFEYMGSKRLMLVSDMPVLKEVLDDSFCMLLPPSDLGAWCDALEKARDADFRSKRADRAFEIYRERYTWKARARRVLAGLEL